MGIHNELKGTHVNFDYDVFDNLIKADYQDRSEVETIYRTPDAIGNLYETSNRSDRKYGKGGRLLEDINYYFHYDVEGNLCFKEFKKSQGFSSIGKEAIERKYKIKFKGSATGWLYEWSANGLLQRVVNPQQGKIRFGYDPLGRRVYKETNYKRTNWLWNGNVPLHEWESLSTESILLLVTWVFEEGTFVPCAKITEDQSYSIVTDYLGTPTQMFDEDGRNVWDAELDIYGKVRTFKGSSLSDCPFRYQGQYEDAETGLYYNRSRYYDPTIGNYISQDPIGLAGNNPTLYGYVYNPNIEVDVLGLDIAPSGTILYHYTNQIGMEGIVESKKIRPSLKDINPKDVRYGNGQYLSDIVPGTKTPSQLGREFIGVPNKYKYTHYVAVDVSGLDVVKGRDGVFVVRGDTELDVSTRIVRSGEAKCGG